MSRPLRILHAPTNTANNPYGLSRAERELGHVSDVADFMPVPGLDYQADVIRDLAGRAGPVHLAVRGTFLARAVARYDVFHFNFGQPLLPLRIGGHVLNELALLKRLRKVVLVTFQGCDVRPMTECSCTKAECSAADRWRPANAAAMLRHADRAYFLNPDLRRYLPSAQFLPYANVDVRAIEPVPPPERNETVIAHAPTDRDVKGTSYIVAAVDALRAEGLPVRLDLIERVPHAQALQRIAAADVLVDQLVLGWYGGVSVEAMALGRPVVTRIEEATPADNPFGERLPVVRADRATVRDRLREVVVDADRRRRLGQAGRAFALAEHDPRVIARRVLDGLQG